MLYIFLFFVSYIFQKRAFVYSLYIHTAVGRGARLRSGYDFNVYKLLGLYFFSILHLVFLYLLWTFRVCTSDADRYKFKNLIRRLPIHGYSYYVTSPLQSLHQQIISHLNIVLYDHNIQYTLLCRYIIR